MIRPLLRRLTTDTDALHTRIHQLTDELQAARAELAKLRTLPPVYNAALSRIADLEAEVERLTPLAGNLDATPAELRALEAVRQATEFGGLNRNAYAHPEHLTALHKKGLVRREKAGQTYRYWPTETA